MNKTGSLCDLRKTRNAGQNERNILVPEWRSIVCEGRKNEIELQFEKRRHMKMIPIFKSLASQVLVYSKRIDTKNESKTKMSKLPGIRR